MKRRMLIIIMALSAAILAQDPAEAMSAGTVAEVFEPGPDNSKGADGENATEAVPSAAGSAGLTVPEPPPVRTAEDVMMDGRERIAAGPKPAAVPKPAVATGKQTVAVYMAGEEPKGAHGVHNILGGELARTITTSGRYLAVDRTEAILEQLAIEHTYQRSGAVDDDQIKNLGRQLGVQYLCISNINNVGRQSYYLDVRLVDVVSAEIINSVTANSNLKDANEMTRVARTIAYDLIETEKAAKERKRKRKILLTTSISLDVLGLGATAYGVLENSNMNSHVDKTSYSEAESAKTRRDAAYIAGAVLLASGLTIHIFF
ncbi:MAG: hypothetical protein FWB85_10310 [Chitinispirillia bacterium]|nr:hypothetical protein [Chitinispirillia bacterium]MCL2242590.1 hypothetical protein [Chitinispirillia bacterium]